MLICYIISIMSLLYITFTDPHSIYRSVTKTLASLCFVLIYLINTNKIDPFFLMGLVSCMLGDIFLSIEKNQQKRFMQLGIFSFLLAHCFYCLSFSNLVSYHIYDLILSLIGLIILKIISIKFDIHFGSKRTIIWTYTFLIFLMAKKAFDIFYYDPNTQTLFLALGAWLFVLSDTLLVFLYFKFKGNTLLSISNSIVYYSSLYLLILAFLES